MKFSSTAWGSLVLHAILAAAATPAKREYDTHDYYALEHKPTDDTSSSLYQVAQALGVEIVEQAGALKNVWLVRLPKEQLVSREEEGVDRVIRAFEDLKAKAESRSLARSEERQTARQIVSSINFLERQTLRTLTKRAPPPVRPQEKVDAVAKRLGIQDPLFPQQWHLVNDEYPEHTMNVLPVWDMGYTGKGVATSFIDDGLDFDSEDLRDAFDAENSYDFNTHVSLPRPVTQEDSHGTRCAGQVAAQRNGVCGVGIAHESTVAGVRILGGPITTADEAAALNYGYQKIDIYSCSWGPPDNGERMEGPRYLVRKAVTEGINNGRGGKGSIFVFASGNGGDSQDQCNFDGYTNSIYSVTVSAIDYKGGHPSYAEACTANMVVAYTSGGGKAITTTDRGKNACTHSHGGTSAAAPNAAGVFALALQARPALTWRDIQHLCVQTAVMVDPEDHGWERTATGRKFNNKYGYGALDGAAYVTAAQRWKLVKPQAWLHTDPIRLNEGKLFDYGKENYTYSGGVEIGPEGIHSKFTITEQMMKDNNLENLEHIDVRVWIEHSKRGDVEIEITSPNGIKSKLANRREYDRAKTGFPGWRFMSVKHWGENPIGVWTLSVFDQQNIEHTGKVLGWSMALWGESIDASKATKFIEPVVDNALQPEDDAPPAAPPIHSTSTTTFPRPTENLSIVTGTAPATARPTTTANADADSDLKQWYETMLNSQKWYYMIFGAIIGLFFGVGFWYWRRKVSERKRAEYASLAADDMPMDVVAEGQPLQSARGGGRQVPSHEDPDSEHSSLISAENARGLGFHTGFLDDDEPTAPKTAPPEYRDDPPTPRAS